MRLLVPVDLSKTPNPNVEGAFSLARICNAELHLVEFLPTPAAGFMETEKTVFEVGYAEQEMLNVHVVQKHREQVDTWADDLRAHGVSVRAEIINDTFNSGLKKYVGRYAIDMIIMEEEGTRNWLEMLTGSRAERAVEKTDCPVLTVQEPFDFEQIDELVVAIDLTVDYEKNSWEIIRRLAKCLKVDTSFLYVNQDLGDVVEVNNRIHAFRQAHGFEGYPVYFVQSEDVEEGIVRFAERKSNCLVATISGASGGLLRMFANSVAEAVMERSDMPVLTLSR